MLYEVVYNLKFWVCPELNKLNQTTYCSAKELKEMQNSYLYEIVSVMAFTKE